MKKIIALATVFALIFTFAACKKDDKKEQPSRNMAQQEVVVHENVTDASGEIVTDAHGEAVTVTEIHTELITEPQSLSANPEEWTIEEIVAYYKSSALKSHETAKSTQTMTLTEMVVNNGDGTLAKAVEFATPFMTDALENNSTEFDGITGGFNNLVVSDVQSARAYKSGNYTVIEMTMKEQTDGLHGDTYSGTVGHAISVVGDISVVQEELPMFDIGFEDAEFSMHYTNPVLKVKINEDGIIEKGTWSYTVEINIKNLKVEFITVDTGYGKVDYEITVGGGF